jgi:hypothetical protein
LKKRLLSLSELDQSDFDDEPDGDAPISPAAFAPFEDFETVSLSSALLSELLTQTGATLEINLPELSEAAGVDVTDIRQAVRYLQTTGALTHVSRRCSSILTAKRGMAA